MTTDAAAEPIRLDFIREWIATDVANGKHGGEVVTRFPPEPNGYLHIGHAKSICLNFGIAQEFGPKARCHLRFDDTNPTKEETEYVDSIMEDVKWLGFEWGSHLHFASDHFPKLYAFAEQLIEKGLAFVCDLTPEEMRTFRGTLTDPGKPSPGRDRSAEENLDLFRRMKAGEFADGTRTLRAKIDMGHANLNMRDPVFYRILRAHHHRTGDAWCVYPMYDFAHPLSDAIEGVTHSICTLEFEDHRPLYEWLIENVDGLPSHPVQREFARLNLTSTVMSKRKLLRLVKEGYVSGWDDPRMPTLSGIRRRGYPAASMRQFSKSIGVTKFNAMTDFHVLENAVREELNKTSLRRIAVLRPLKLVLTNYPEDQVEFVEVPNNPEAPETGTRQVPLSRELFIERDDFAEEPPKGWRRFTAGAEVRLTNAFCVSLTEIIKNEAGEVVELRATYDDATRHGAQPVGRPKVKAAVHWVSAAHAVSAPVRLYDHLFALEHPDAAEGEFTDHLNPTSLEMLTETKLEPALADALPGQQFQFIRLGYFIADSRESIKGLPVFNRTVNLR
ncbi:glutamine--tRNA ligase/YqeY domain fusion protein [Phragmitibacter flavus]|uniref:Glutamine--tRNA ligase n=1 Tax=Phragmitibacter flavus TaxID=2576071 RepID=A0A5R8KBC8_9BACT|nr:glutamine--tRNA ligase/YqeY domain fusion protein [Phragmitibacter flavus]TLD69612.1 glutamine--tRNA ligase/YqeY domain fusion protein [Phragmitibacter flavus]